MTGWVNLLLWTFRLIASAVAAVVVYIFMLIVGISLGDGCELAETGGAPCIHIPNWSRVLGILGALIVFTLVLRLTRRRPIHNERG